MAENTDTKDIFQL